MRYSAEIFSKFITTKCAIIIYSKHVKKRRGKSSIKPITPQMQAIILRAVKNKLIKIHINF
jgi:hypothetical protein